MKQRVRITEASGAFACFFFEWKMEKWGTRKRTTWIFNVTAWKKMCLKYFYLMTQFWNGEKKNTWIDYENPQPTFCSITKISFHIFFSFSLKTCQSISVQKCFQLYSRQLFLFILNVYEYNCGLDWTFKTAQVIIK